jgi:hypothetical protein
LCGNVAILAKSYLIQCKAVTWPGESEGGEKGEIENAGSSHDVIENKRREDGDFDSSHDVYESK